MIYSEIPKMDSKQFVIKSNKTHIILNASIIKIIKYKIYYNKIPMFYKNKHDKKIYQRFITTDYFSENAEHLDIYVIFYYSIKRF